MKTGHNESCATGCEVPSVFMKYCSQAQKHSPKNRKCCRGSHYDESWKTHWQKHMPNTSLSMCYSSNCH